MKNEYYETPKSGILMQLFWKAAGADRFLLERSTYSEQVKYFCMGGIVIATGVMASLAGGYAFYTIFSPKSADVLDKTKTVSQNLNYVPVDLTTVVLALFFGVIWGLIIFNIDRFIVTSTGKGDGTEAITWQEFKSAIPRIIMGMIIALTISKPVEIRMFKSEIDREIQKQQDIEEQIDIDGANQKFENSVKETKSKLGKIQTQIDNKINNVNDLRNEISKEITGKNNNGAAYGPRAQELERQANIIESQINILKSTPEFISAQKDIKNFDSIRKVEIKYAKKKVASLDGLLIRIQKSHELSPWISFFITLLFMVIELTPIFFKMMLIKGPYDYMDENVKDLAIAEYGIEVTSEFYEDKNGNQITKTVNHAAEIKKREKILLLRVQEELNEQIINNWKEKKSKEIDENPDAFIQES